jgi:hypothetical protein
MADTPISELSAASVVADNDIAVTVQGGETKKCIWSIIKSYILGGKTIGGSATGDIATNNGTQTQTNKTLVTPIINTPKLNGSVQLESTSTELNKMHGLLTSAAELGYVKDVSAPIQAQLDLKLPTTYLADIITRMKVYSLEFEYDAATKTITEDDILGGDFAHYVGRHVLVQQYKFNGSNDMVAEKPEVKLCQRTNSSTVHLDKIELSSLTSGVYLIVLGYQLVPIPGTS